VLIFTGSNLQAKALLDFAHKDTYLQNSKNVWMEKWGTLRMDLDFLEKKMREQKKPMFQYIVKTWRWMHVPPPKITIWGPPLHEIDLSLGYKFSLDFQLTGNRASMWSLELALKAAVQQLNSYCDNKVNLQTSSRRGFGNQTWDQMQAWDLTIAENNIDQACGIMCQLVDELWEYNPTAGYQYSFSHFEMFKSPLVEFTHSDAIFGLKKKNLIVWVYFVSSQMAIVDFTKGTDTGEALEQALQACIAWNREQTKQYKETAKQGSFIDRIVLSKAMMEEPSIKALMHDTKDRIFWDKSARLLRRWATTLWTAGALRP
jgi:hypothetical protein